MSQLDHLRSRFGLGSAGERAGLREAVVRELSDLGYAAEVAGGVRVSSIRWGSVVLSAPSPVAVRLRMDLDRFSAGVARRLGVSEVLVRVEVDAGC